MALSVRAKAIRAARNAANRVAGCAVVLQRTTDDLVKHQTTVNAILAETEIDEVYESGAAVTTRYHDFLIRAEDYCFSTLNDGLPVTPEVNDVVEIELDDGLTRFSLVPNGERPYRRSDRYGYVYRCHAKEIVLQ